MTLLGLKPLIYKVLGEGLETSFLKNDTAYIVGFSGSQKSEHIYPHINTYKHTSKGGGFTVERYI